MTAAERRPAPFYGRRQGRKLNQGRATLLADLLPQLRLELPEMPGKLELDRLFTGPLQDIWLEVGFGSGEHLAAQARRHPEIGFVGCEPFLNGVSSLLGLIQHDRLRNVRIFPDDARLLLDALPDASVGRSFLLFSDPWPKKRHHRRRFIGQENLDRLSRVLKAGAELRLSTDDPDLADWTLEHLGQHHGFSLAQDAVRRERPADWPGTRYEEKAIAAGRPPFYISAHAR
jgi:tRNA (guanine-N7-)-methyltransferase